MRGALVVFLALPAAAAERSTSTARAENPWAMELRYDDRGQSVNLNYRIRWDPRDLLDRPRETLQSPVRSLGESVTDILQSSRMSFYGVHMKPFRREDTAADFGLASSTAAATAPAARRRGLSLNLDRAIGELRFSAEREAQRWLVREAFDQSVRGARAAPYWQKEAAVRSLDDAAQSWRED